MILPNLKTIALAAVATAVLSAAAFGAGYLKGKAASEQAHASGAWRAFADAVQTAADVARDAMAIGEQLRDALAASRATEQTHRPIIREALDANPGFADQRRPPALERVRRDELEAIHAATEAGRLRD